jgi:hypothetical protein
MTRSINANLVPVFDGRMAFVPEGQADRSLARSACHPKEPSRRVRCDSCRCARRFDDWSDEFQIRRLKTFTLSVGLVSCARSYRTLRDGSLEPFDALSLAHGRGCFPRHFVPGYYHAVPPGQNTFDRRGSV